MGTVRFGNDQFAPILGYGDLVQGNITINRVYYVEGLNHNLFSVGQFCDADLEVAFRNLRVLLEIFMETIYSLVSFFKLLCITDDIEDMTFNVYALPCYGLVLFVMALFIHAL
ncbi:hypothetical protein Tco_1086854 [Tanacetum coccineum]